MSDRQVRTLLFMTIFVVSVLPLIAALYFLDSSLKTSLSLGFNAQVAQALEDGSQNLKTLRKLDSGNQGLYRRQFESLQELQHVYADPQVIRQRILDSLRIYFAAGLIAAIMVAVFLATLLGRRIARAYKYTFDELLAHREKVRYLQEISSWQELAKVLAHEIKNPLTPIDVLVSSLDKSHRDLSTEEFASHLRRTQETVSEEIQHLKRTVSKFSDFARLPAVQLAPADLHDVLTRNAQAVAIAFENAQIELIFTDNDPMQVQLDTTLFRQVLANIVRNGVEANPERSVRFFIEVNLKVESVEIAIGNDGVQVPIELASRIFDPYVSGKNNRDSMGLGLAIVRKIVIDHGGDIRYEVRENRPVFAITLPRLAR